MIDALHWVAEQPAPAGAQALLAQVGLGNGATEGRRLVLVTAHRRENFGAPLEAVCGALRTIAERGAGQVQIVYAVHLNPNVRERVHRLLGEVPNVTLTPPLDYATLVHLLRRAYLVLTDSGGIQEEAPGLGVPVLVLRDVTERPVGSMLARCASSALTTALLWTPRTACLNDPAAYQRMRQAVNPYGDGRASRRIVAALLGETCRTIPPTWRREPGRSGQ